VEDVHGRLIVTGVVGSATKFARFRCAPAASITSTSSSRRSSAACRSTATCSAHSAGTGSERGETIWYLTGRDTSIGLRAAQSESPPHDRYSVGLHHLAIEVASRGTVDERADWLRSAGAEIESEPQEYTYIPGYYAVFFYDPDGLKLEILHVPALAA
jgi:hypothetical protein